MENNKMTTSEQIRQLHDVGMKTKDIAKQLGIRYQFAYNVISAYLLEQKIAASAPKNVTEPSIAPVVVNPEPAKPEIVIVPEVKPVVEIKAPIVADAGFPPKAEVQTVWASPEPVALRALTEPAVKKENKESVLARLFRK